MTIKYALTRIEVVEFFLQGMVKSPRYLATILILLLWPAVIYLLVRGALSRTLTVIDLMTSLEWTFGFFCFMLVWIFIRAKTDERTLSVSESGISTTIGRLGGRVQWNKIKTISDMGRYVLIARTAGNAFFIPNRAFTGPDHRAEFIAQIRLWKQS